jgi:putative ABC transport system permease protein
MNDFSIVLRSLRARMFQTVATSLTVALAVALLLMMLGAREASRAAFARGSGNMHLLIARDASPLSAVLNGVFLAGAPRRSIPWAEHQRLAESYPWEFFVPVQVGDSYRGRPVLATTPEFFERFQPVPGVPWSLREGRFFAAPFEIVLGADAAAATGLRVGDTIALTHGAVGMSGQPAESGTSTAALGHVHQEYPFTVVGVLGPTGGPHDRALMTELTGSWVLHAHDRRVAELGEGIPLATPADLLEPDRLITGVYARLATRPGRDASALMQQAFDELRREPDLTVAAPAAQIAQLFSIVSNIETILLGLAALVLITSGVTIMIALYSSMEQRRRQIAVLRVLGCSRGRVVLLVVTEAVCIGLAGALAGALLGQVGSLLVGQTLQSRLGVVLEPWLPLRWVLASLTGTMALSALAGALPALLGYRVAVVDHLRPLA